MEQLKFLHCPICKRGFIQRTANQRYDTMRCKRIGERRRRTERDIALRDSPDTPELTILKDPTAEQIARVMEANSIVPNAAVVRLVGIIPADYTEHEKIVAAPDGIGFLLLP